MFRGILMTVALAAVACARDDGPTKMSAPTDGNYAAAVSNPGEGGVLNSDDARAQALMTHVHAIVRECDGPDGHYGEAKNVFTGMSTGDPRLSGAVEFAMIHDLLNVTQSSGPDEAKITIRDPSTGRVKAEGSATSWGRDDWLQGMIVGFVSDEGGGTEESTGSGNWVANFSVRFTGHGATIDIGGVSTPSNQPAAGIASGGCPGVKYSEFDIDFGASAVTNLLATMATGAWRARAGM